MQRMWVVPEEGRTRLLALTKIKWQRAESLRKKNIGNERASVKTKRSRRKIIEETLFPAIAPQKNTCF